MYANPNGGGGGGQLTVQSECPSRLPAQGDAITWAVTGDGETFGVGG